MKRLRLVGLSHKTAPLELREPLAMDVPQAADACREVAAALGEGGEAVLISTCNRVELYTTVDVEAQDAPDPLEILCRLRGVDVALVNDHVYRHRGEGTVRHLFQVAASLDSLVPGERQILGQVRVAYELAKRNGTAGRLLHGLFQRALAVGKQVMHTTDLGAGRHSVASIAVAYVDQIFDRLDDKMVLCIGAGKMTRLVLERLRERAPGRLVVANRDPQKAQEFARRFCGEGRALAELDRLLVEADIVITSTGSREPVISAQRLRPLLKARRYRPLFLIDIAVPRDVEPAVSNLTNVYLFDIDDLQSAVALTTHSHAAALEAARRIVDAHVAGFVEWHRGRDLGPTIDRLYRRSHEMAIAELARTLRKLPDLDMPSRRRLEVMSRRIVNKLLHGPVSTLRQAAAEQRHGLAYQHAVEKLFALDTPDPAPAPPDESDADTPMS